MRIQMMRYGCRFLKHCQQKIVSDCNRKKSVTRANKIPLGPGVYKAVTQTQPVPESRELICLMCNVTVETTNTKVTTNSAHRHVAH